MLLFGLFVLCEVLGVDLNVDFVDVIVISGVIEGLFMFVLLLLVLIRDG